MGRRMWEAAATFQKARRPGSQHDIMAQMGLGDKSALQLTPLQQGFPPCHSSPPPGLDKSALSLQEGKCWLPSFTNSPSKWNFLIVNVFLDCIHTSKQVGKGKSKFDSKQNLLRASNLKVSTTTNPPGLMGPWPLC